MVEKIDILYFPGDDRAEDASEVVKDIADASLTRAGELTGCKYAFNWISEKEDLNLTIGLRLLKRLKNDYGIEVLDNNNAKVPEKLKFLADSDPATIEGKYPKVSDSAVSFIKDAANSLLKLNVLVPVDGVMAHINRVGYSYKGSTGTLSGKGTPASINVFMRKKLFSDVCVRDFKNVAPQKYKQVDVSMAVFVGPEGVVSNSPHLTGTDFTDAQIITEKSKAITLNAFQYAKDKGIKKVYVTQKANILKESDGAFIEYAKQVAADFPDIALEVTIFDNMLQRISKNPDWFGVVVTSKFYGDEFLVPLANAMFKQVDEKDFGKDVGYMKRFEGRNYDFTAKKIDTRCYRQNSEGFYIGEGKSTGTESINFRRITLENTQSLVKYALDDTLNRKKKTVFILYSEGLKGDEIFLSEAKKVASDKRYSSLDIKFMKIKDYCKYTVENPEKIDSVIGTNLVMDFLTDAEASKIGGIGMMPSFNYTVKTGFTVSEPGHGTAPDLEPNRINPGASLWAMAALLEHMGNDNTGRLNENQKTAVAKAATLINQATEKFYSAGQGLTGDLGGTGTTKSVGDAIKTIIAGLK